MLEHCIAMYVFNCEITNIVERKADTEIIRSMS